MKTIVVLLLFTGILLIIIDLVRSAQKCPQQQIIYRYIPRTFNEEQNEQALPSQIFKAMFSQPSPWIGQINDIDINRKESVDNFFASQV